MEYSKKSIWKWVLIYVAVGAVAHGLIYYFFFYKKGDYSYNLQNQTENSETADWKTYTNDEYGFEFKYPGEWKVGEERASGDYFMVLIGRQEPVQVYGIFALAVRYKSKNEYLSSLESVGYINVGESDTLLGGEKATFYTYSRNNSDLKWRMIVAEKDGNTIEFSMGATEEYDNVFNNILSTFKFTK